LKPHLYFLASLLVSLGVAAPIEVLAQAAPAQGRPTQSVQLQSKGDIPSLSGAVEWMNSPPLSPSALRGKVVLVDFWTYTCINWLRTLPYLRAWAEKYKDHGLVVVGVHTPEFDFERNLTNVRRAVTDMRITFPVAVDSDGAIWRAFDNHYWPALYFVDAKGQIRHQQFGEGHYEDAERVVQTLLLEAGARDVPGDLVTVTGEGAEAAPDWSNLQSPENYLGYERTENFGSPGGALPAKSRAYASPSRLKLNHWALGGQWTFSKQFAMLDEATGRLAYRFHARDFHLVMGPASPNAAVRFRLLIDGKPPLAAHGVDVDEQGYGTVTAQRLYQLVRQPMPIADRLLEIRFLDPGVEVFAATFG
jgi:thiol-disulfide isomerase/thioredoxin